MPASRDRIILWTATLGSIVLVVGGLIALAVYSSHKTSGPVPGVNEISANDWVFGNPDATVTLVEYGDFQCPACGTFYPIVKQVSNDYKDTVRFVFRHFPLPQHQNAKLAAYAAEAAGLQGKFWEMHDKLYETQDAWSNFDSSKARQTFTTYATDLGLNIDQWKKDVDSDNVHERVSVDTRSGEKAGVDSTPSFYLNGTKLQPRGYDDFKTAIDKELKSKP